jgi:hypothetical protein
MRILTLQKHLYLFILSIPLKIKQKNTLSKLNILPSTNQLFLKFIEKLFTYIIE